MTLNEYQVLAARTIATDNVDQMERHALYGLTAECAELLEACFLNNSRDHIIKECGDVCWMAAELCTARGWHLSDVVRYIEWTVPTQAKDVTDLIVLANGNLQSVYQKVLQGHEYKEADVKDEINAIFEYIDKIAFHCNYSLEDAMIINIEKLKTRYPEGFSTDQSLHRADGDI